MRIIFLSTPEFGIPSLEKLLSSSKHEVVAVVTQVDKPAGRGNKLCASPIKEFALKNNLKVLQYEKISRDGVEELTALQPDIMITAAYGQILSPAVISIPKYGIINIHGSILPKYRGASPVQSAVLNGDEVTGITIMQTEAGLDTGDILMVDKTEIGENETAGELMKRLSVIGANLLATTLDLIESGEIEPRKQHHTEATITTKIKKTDCLINWNKSAKQIKCLILASNPDPIARTFIGKDQIKIYRARIADIPSTGEECGTVIEPTSAKNGVFVQCGQGVLELLEVQFPGGKVLPAVGLVNGRKLKVGTKFIPLVYPFQVEHSKE